MKSIEKCIAFAFIAFNFCMFAAQTGKVLPASTEPISGWIPVLFLGMMTVPAALMYIAGKKDGRAGSGDE